MVPVSSVQVFGIYQRADNIFGKFSESWGKFFVFNFFVCSERDNLDRRIVELEKACTVYKTELEARSNQVEAVRSQVIHSKLLF